MLEKYEYYKKINQEESERIHLLEKKYNNIAFLRLVLFIAAFVCLVVGFKDGVAAAKVLGFVALVGFVALAILHESVDRQRHLAKSKCAVADRYEKRFGEGWKEFDEDGSTYLSENDTVAADVDLLGKASLFRMINVAHTAKGKERLAKDICNPEILNKTDFESKQKAVLELANKTDFAIEFEMYGEYFESFRKKGAELTELDSKENASMPAWANVARVMMPIAEIALIILAVAGILNVGIPLVGFFVVLAFSWLTSSVINSILASFGHEGFKIDAYEYLMRCICETEFEAERLTKIKEKYIGKEGTLLAVKKLSGIVQLINIMYNPLIHQLLSGLVLWDYQVASKICKWKKQYGDVVADGIDGISEMEYLSSLATIGRVRECSLPNISNSNDALNIEAKAMMHPLIAPDKVVANDASIDGKITIITGSNMSGKTTFMRTVAVNLVLAYLGAPVCAKEFDASYMKLFTSMRVTDDVANGISTFYAEILRIKAMAEHKDAHKNAPMLCLIDEIFKGTNSADRIVGAREAITRLADTNCMVIVSTHDFELCTIEDKSGKAADNYHFEEYYDNDVLKFDYKMRSGRCTTTNALAILKMAGFDIK